MQTIQVVLDESLLAAADEAARRAQVNRSALVRAALRDYLKNERRDELEERDRRGYERRPIGDELADWDRVAAWPEER